MATKPHIFKRDGRWATSACREGFASFSDLVDQLAQDHEEAITDKMFELRARWPGLNWDRDRSGLFELAQKHVYDAG